MFRRCRLPLLALLSLLLTTPLLAGSRADEQARAKLIAGMGFEQFPAVREVRFTFNVSRGGKVMGRSWRWQVDEDRVTYRGPDDQGQLVQVSYQRAALTEQPDAALTAIDRKFINDSFWLLLPLHLQWNPQVTVRDLGPAKLPLSAPGPAVRKLLIEFPSAGGYTPGDVYELFVDEAYQPVQWVFRRSGQPTPSLICTWERYVQAGPLRLSTYHRNPQAGFTLWMTDVAVETRR